MQLFADAIHVRYVNIDTIVRALDDTIDVGERSESVKRRLLSVENENDRDLETESKTSIASSWHAFAFRNLRTKPKVKLNIPLML